MPLSEAKILQNSPLALWRINGPSLDALRQEAETDAANFIDTEQDLDLTIVNCTPSKIEGGRIERWKAWAILSFGHIEPALLLETIKAQEDIALRLYNAGG